LEKFRKEKIKPGKGREKKSRKVLAVKAKEKKRKWHVGTKHCGCWGG